METGMEMNGSYSSRKREHEEYDRLSSLSDEVIFHVMSFLTTKDAVRTCVLSRRWLFLWKSLPYLCFDARSFGDDDVDVEVEEYEQYKKSKMLRFSNFIRQMLLRRCPTNLVKVRFNSRGYKMDSLMIESLISYALEHKVQELDICASFVRDIVFPHCFSSCELLTKLKLKSLYLYNIKKLHLPALQSLTLSSFRVTDQDFLLETFSSCPDLQTLRFVNIDFGDLESLSIRTPNLKKLEFSYSWRQSYLRGFKVVIDAPKLTTFKFNGYTPMWCLSDNIASLDEVHFCLEWKDTERILEDDIEDYKYDQEDFLCLVNTFKVFTHAKSLTLSLQTIKAFAEVPALLEEAQLVFPNLKHLNLIVWMRREDLAIPTSVLNMFLTNSPLLRIYEGM